VLLRAQDVELSTHVSKKTLGVNEKLRIEFTITTTNSPNEDMEFELPNFTNFNMEGNIGSSVRRQSGTYGKNFVSKTYTYIISPKNTGEFTIPPAVVTYKGKRIESNTVTVTVTDKVEKKEPKTALSDEKSDDIVLTASVSNTNPYVGESIYVEYRLYYRINYYNNEFGDMPKLEGFWSQEIDTNEGRQIGEYNGERYYYHVLKKVVLIPQKSGKLYIDPIEMTADFRVPTGKRDFFGRQYTKSVTQKFSTGRKLIKVKALPNSGKPHDFTGAVGDFNLSVTASKSVLKANESTQIKVTVSGKGNFKLFEIPKINTPAELEVYTPEHKERVRTTLNGLKGSITDDYAIVPGYKGKFKIPAVSFSYFSLKDKSYKTLTSEPVIIDVTEGKDLPTTVMNTSKDVSKQMVSSRGEDFRYIHSNTVLSKKTTKDFYGSKLFYLLNFLAFALIPIALFFGRKHKQQLADVTGNRIRKADKLARKYLSEAKKQMGNKETFYVALEKALHNFLKAKLQIETSDMSKERITTILTERLVSTNTTNTLIDVLSSCEFARYAPTSDSVMQEDYKKASRVLNEINNEIR